MPYPATLLSSTTSSTSASPGMPGVNGGASTFVGGDGIGVSKDSKHEAQAWNFLVLADVRGRSGRRAGEGQRHRVAR